MRLDPCHQPQGQMREAERAAAHEYYSSGKTDLMLIANIFNAHKLPQILDNERIESGFQSLIS